MKLGVHRERLKQACAASDAVYWLEPESSNWSLAGTAASGKTEHHLCRTTADIIAKVTANAVPGERVIVMSNGSFDGIHHKLIDALRGQNG